MYGGRRRGYLPSHDARCLYSKSQDPSVNRARGATLWEHPDALAERMRARPRGGIFYSSKPAKVEFGFENGRFVFDHADFSCWLVALIFLGFLLETLDGIRHFAEREQQIKRKSRNEKALMLARLMIS